MYPAWFAVAGVIVKVLWLCRGRVNVPHGVHHMYDVRERGATLRR